jgi:hypothetical protein
MDSLGSAEASLTSDATRPALQFPRVKVAPFQIFPLPTFQNTSCCKRRQLPATMFKASLLIASLAFAATASAADQVATKGSLVVGASQNLAEAISASTVTRPATPCASKRAELVPTTRHQRANAATVGSRREDR